MSDNNDNEIIKFLYFSETGECGKNAEKHEKYCKEMVNNGYRLNRITPLGNLDDRRDSYEGTIIYHWRKLKRSNKNDSQDM
mgnify:CR=1 FL=1|jgi:hypothetical protein|uniref:Uncharacterized protein n=1 Tax=viral metagenome TaxID=1070528 RepID=A0A6C0AJU1_9ZZZZ